MGIIWIDGKAFCVGFERVVVALELAVSIADGDPGLPLFGKFDAHFVGDDIELLQLLLVGVQTDEEFVGECPGWRERDGDMCVGGGFFE